MVLEKQLFDKGENKMTNTTHSGDRVIFFDTTARDGKQAPGNNFGPEDTVRLAQQLVKMRVNIMEAGFPFSSPADFESVRSVATQVHGIHICALARAVEGDITQAARALDGALESPRIHTFIGSSDQHIREKFAKDPQEIVGMAVRAIEHARHYVDDVEFSPEDASRTGFDFLKQIVREAIIAGATTINIPDTVGYSVGDEFGNTIRRLIKEVPIITERGVIVSVHCHNDLDMAAANALAGLANGARQVECTINGIGERAGNTHIAPVAMALKRRQDHYGLKVDIDTTQIGPTAHLLSQIIGKPIPDTLPTVGENVFAHSSGIHQDGISKSKGTYEIMRPEDVGWVGETFPLSSQSGRSGLFERLVALGYNPNANKLQAIYERFVTLAKDKPKVHNQDLHMLMQEVEGESHEGRDGWIKLTKVNYNRTDGAINAAISLRSGAEILRTIASGNGPVNAAAEALQEALTPVGLWPCGARLTEFDIGKSVGGTEALSLSTVCITYKGKFAYGRGADTDIVVASARAIVAALNHLRFSPVSK